MKRARADPAAADPGPSRSLALGTFDGSTIWRNRLAHTGETFAAGHLTLRNLVPPGCTALLATTFLADEGLGWLQSWAGAIPTLLVVRNDDREKLDKRVVGDAQLEAMRTSRGSRWQWLRVSPHTGGTLHAKLLLMRSPAGLRVVVPGNNLISQWEADRDALWVQDFELGTGAAGTSAAGTFEADLRAFLARLLECRAADDTASVRARLAQLLDGIDFSPARAGLVDSFPVARDSGVSQGAGGWKRLATAVRAQAAAHPPKASEADAADGTVYCMAGSFGNLKPEFLVQLREAMHGREPSRKPRKGGKGSKGGELAMDGASEGGAGWEAVGAVRALWPSLRTGLTIDPVGIISSLRAIPMSVWNGDGLSVGAAGLVFHDAPPNPQWAQPDTGTRPVAHAKVLIALPPAPTQRATCYVGSHNLSEAAWGLKGGQPKNIELGVVLCTSDPALRQQWVQRLPCTLPTQDEQALTAAERGYTPASAHKGVRDLWEAGEEDEALDELKGWLESRTVGPSPARGGNVSGQLLATAGGGGGGGASSSSAAVDLTGDSDAEEGEAPGSIPDRAISISDSDVEEGADGEVGVVDLTQEG